MRRLVIALIAYVLSPSFSHAIPNLSVDSISCYGTQTTAISDGLSISCTGDLSLLGGSITADTQILLSSGGALTLDNLAVTAPHIQLFGSTVSIGAGVVITINSLTVTAGIGGGSNVPSISAGSTISIGGQEPRQIVIGDVLLPPGGREPIIGGGPGGSITIMPSVPEPSIYASMLIGLLVLAGIFRNKAPMA